MKILVFSINPLFEDRVIGGSTKHLQNIAVRLGTDGHHVTILCTKREDTNTPFNWHPNVLVKPSLTHKQPFPQPYEIPHYEMANNIQLIGDHLAESDRFYMQDGELLYPPLLEEIPTIVSLRDNAYPETMLGSFLFAGDALIPISGYSERVYKATAGRFNPELGKRIRTIPNGIDFSLFKPTQPSEELIALLGIDPRGKPIVLHPHRPEISKGMQQTVAIVNQLVHRFGHKELKVLVPKWFDAALSPEVSSFYEDIENQIDELSLRDNFIFHGWVPQRLMPEYFSLGNVMLALGHFIEAFGNATYESLACGTPSVVARVGPYRDLLPDELHDKVHFDDNEATAVIADEIIRSGRRTSPETLSCLKSNYSIAEQLNAYTDTIENAKKLPPIQQSHTESYEIFKFELAPWCYRSGEGRYFHDYRAAHKTIPILESLLRDNPIIQVTKETPNTMNNYIQTLYQDGYIVPVH